ncbi:hypothetical protein ACFW84_03320 [Streptomyces anulatus]|uniref:hypothetical protein n=1 Tax=Streptomyces anulatus TaxID=1892 RepID=UPI00367D4930
MNTEVISDSAALQGSATLADGCEYIVLEISARLKKAPSFRMEFIESDAKISFEDLEDLEDLEGLEARSAWMCPRLSS